MNTATPPIHHLAAAIADGSRARLLCVLMDGRAHTNKELASLAGLSPATTSAHLTRLSQAGLTVSLRSGRHVYHKIASARIAALLEELAVIGPPPRARPVTAPGARRCYNHLAGRLGVAVTQAMVARAAIDMGDEMRDEMGDKAVTAGPELARLLRDLGIRGWRAPDALAKPCLDWTERRFHLSGALATRMMTHFLDHDWLRPGAGTRGLIVTPTGIAGLARHFGLRCTADGPVSGPVS